MTNLPLVSIVTPAYNAGKFIEDTLRSVICQEYPKIEHIVLDDGSTDNTPHILKRYERAYNLKWLSKSNEGQAATLNKCVELAKGELVVVLNADDVLFDEKTIANIVQYFRLNHGADVAYGHMIVIDEERRLLKTQYTIPWFSYERLLQYHYAYFIAYRREVIRKHQFDHNLEFTMDYEQALRMAKAGVKFGCLNKILYGYRRHKKTKSLSRRKDQRVETKDVQRRYGRKFSFQNLAIRLFDLFVLLCLKIYGLKTITDLFSCPEKFRLAFPIRFGSPLKMAVGQIAPYVTIEM